MSIRLAGCHNYVYLAVNILGFLWYLNVKYLAQAQLNGARFRNRALRRCLQVKYVLFVICPMERQTKT